MGRDPGRQFLPWAGDVQVERATERLEDPGGVYHSSVAPTDCSCKATVASCCDGGLSNAQRSKCGTGVCYVRSIVSSGGGAADLMRGGGHSVPPTTLKFLSLVLG